MKLSNNFTMNEFIRSSAGEKMGINNTPPPELIPALLATAQMLERIRELTMAPIKILSGYRSKDVNQIVGGAKNSDHMRGQAVDIICPGFGSPFALASLIADNLASASVGRVIYERKRHIQWVHVSTATPSNGREKILTICDARIYTGLVDS